MEADAHMTDPFLHVEYRMLDDERAQVLAYATRLNPSLHGAGVADVLSILEDRDAFLAVTEPFEEAYGEAMRREGVPIVRLRAAAIVAVILCDAADEGEGNIPKAMPAMVRRLAS